MIEAFILKTAAGQWKFEIHQDGEEIAGGAGFETQGDAIEAVSELDYEGIQFVLSNDV